MEAGVPGSEDKLRGELHNARYKGEHTCHLYLAASQALAQGTRDDTIRNLALIDISQSALEIANDAIRAVSPEHLGADQAIFLRHLLNNTVRKATPMITEVVAARVEEDAERIRLVNQAITAHLAWRSGMRGPRGFHSNWARFHDPAPLSPDSRDSALPSGDQAAAKLRLERELTAAQVTSNARMREQDLEVCIVNNRKSVNKTCYMNVNMYYSTHSDHEECGGSAGDPRQPQSHHPPGAHPHHRGQPGRGRAEQPGEGPGAGARTPGDPRGD